MSTHGVNGAAASAAVQMRATIEALETQRNELVADTAALTQSLKTMRAFERSLIMGGKGRKVAPASPRDDAVRPARKVQRRTKSGRVGWVGELRHACVAYLKDHPGSERREIAAGLGMRATAFTLRRLSGNLSANQSLFQRTGSMRHSRWSLVDGAEERLAMGEPTRRGATNNASTTVTGPDGLSYLRRTGKKGKLFVAPGVRRGQIIADLAKHGASTAREISERLGIRTSLVLGTCHNHHAVFRMAEGHEGPARERIISLQQGLAAVAGARA